MCVWTFIVPLTFAGGGFVRCDIPLCDEHGSHPVEPFCMPDDYNKDLVPPTEGPLNVNVDIWVFEVRVFAVCIRI